MALKITATDRKHIDAARAEFRSIMTATGGEAKKADRHVWMVLMSKKSWGKTPEGFTDYAETTLRAHYATEAAAREALAAFNALGEGVVGNATAHLNKRHGRIFRATA